MALERFIETYTFDATTFNAVAASHKITESEIKTIRGYQLSESTKRLIEDSSVLASKTVWRFPVARYDNINLNNRKYEKRLWDRVIKEQEDVYKGGAGLKKHPKDGEDGEIEEQAVVWLNMGLNEGEKIVWAEGVFVGEIGRHIEEILECGGRPGFSSSGARRSALVFLSPWPWRPMSGLPKSSISLLKQKAWRHSSVLMT